MHTAGPRQRSITTPELEIGYLDAGPPEGDPVILLHGFPYDVHAYADEAPEEFANAVLELAQLDDRTRHPTTRPR